MTSKGEETAEISGRASPKGTRTFAEGARRAQKVSSDHFRSFGDLELSSLGMGTYLGEMDESTDRAVEEAVVASLASGAVNVIDTAINYRHQRAERCVGRGLARAIREGKVQRDQVFISTKNGYLAPDSESGLSPRVYVQQELVGTGALSPSDIVGGSHAMSVPYLRDQLARSLNNLGLATVDLLYLHNAPEAQLVEVGRKVFFDRLRSAFEFFESARRKDRVVSYGLATWDALRKSRNEEGYLSLEEAVGVAREVAGSGHGFRFVQFPFNTLMPEAFQLRNQLVSGERVSLLEAAHRLGVGTFSSVPLMQGALAQGSARRHGLTSAQAALQFARSTPNHLAPLAGQKGLAHVRENLDVAKVPRLSDPEFLRLIDAV